MTCHQTGEACYCTATAGNSSICYGYYSNCTSSTYDTPEKIVYDLSIFSEWLRWRPLTALYRLPRLFQRWVRWIERRAEPRWRAGRWKAKT